MEHLNMQIPPFIRIDLFQIIVVHALSNGNQLSIVTFKLYLWMYLSFHGYNFLMWTHELTHTHNLTLHTQVNEMKHIVGFFKALFFW